MSRFSRSFIHWILDHEEMIAYWVREVPTPEQAKELLREYGRQPQEWD